MLLKKHGKPLCLKGFIIAARPLLNGNIVLVADSANTRAILERNNIERLDLPNPTFKNVVNIKRTFWRKKLLESKKTCSSLLIDVATPA
ncbi:hypothetical protein KEM52_003019 [Ascosphaera acerosa]|nr:hypothetical protein KEM52_003019 [Ascosphaera acerosa]